VPDPVTLEHRATLDTFRRDTASKLAWLWLETFDVADVNGSWTRFSVSAVPLVQDGYELSTSDAVAYLRRFRRTQGVSGSLPMVPPPGLDRLRVRRSLEYTARITTLRGIQVGKTPTQAAEAALTRTLGASGRFLTEGSHATVRATVEADRQARGYTRVTAAEPCAFCAMLAARGPVYRTQSSASFRAHDHCACTAEPLYREYTPEPNVQQWADLYDRTAKGTPDPLNAFRRAYEGGLGVAA